MDDSLCPGALLSVGVYVGHHIVTYFLFPCSGNLIIDVVRMAFQLIDLRLRDRQAQLLFRFGQSDPQPAPGAELHIL